MFLRERLPELDSIERMAHVAEQYMDAHCCTITGKSRRRDGQSYQKSSGFKPKNQNSSAQNFKDSREGGATSFKKPVVCFLCQRTGHMARECRAGLQNKQQKAAAAQTYVKSGKGDQDEGHNDKSQKKGKNTEKSVKHKDADLESAAACQNYEKSLNDCLTGDGLKLANGDVVPIVVGACDQHSEATLSHNLPMSDGYIGNVKVRVLRDSGCSSAAVKRDLVQPEQMTGKVHICKLFDSSLRQYPIARIHVDTPYYTGEVEAMVVKKPICDLIIGNIPGARDLRASDIGPQYRDQAQVLEASDHESCEEPVVSETQKSETIVCETQKSETEVSETQESVQTGLIVVHDALGVELQTDGEGNSEMSQDCKEEAVAVVTRAQAKKAEQKLKPLPVAPTPGIQSVDLAELKKAQKEDSSLEKLWELATESRQLYTRGQHGYKYEIKDNVLYRVYAQPRGDSAVMVRQIVVPTKYRGQVMSLAHESIVGGHLGVQKTTDRIASSFHWPGITADVTRYCRSCDICQRTIPKGKIPKIPLGEMPIIDSPFKRVAIDLIGPIAPVSDRGNRYILTLVDYGTRYPEAVALPKIETERVAEALLEIFCRVGFPAEILSDRGTQFTSELMGEVARLVRVKQLFTTPYNPACNGLCERVNGVLKAMLKRMCQERPRDWDRYLPAVLFAYREVPQASTGFSPFEMLYGRTVRGPMQVLKELWTHADTPETRSTYQYVLDLRNRLEETCQLARESLYEAQGVYKHHYDKKTKERKFKVGQRVLVLLPTDHNKLLLQWKGPFRVSEVVNDFDYKVNLPGSDKVYHANLLKLYVEREHAAACGRA